MTFDGVLDWEAMKFDSVLDWTATKLTVFWTGEL